MRRSSKRKKGNLLQDKHPVLAKVTADHAKSERIMSYPEIQGFLLVMASAPETVSPSEFLPIVFKSDDGIKLDFLTSEVSANDLLQDIMSCYNDIVSQLHSQKFNAPPGYQRPQDILELFGDDNVLHLWTLGFLAGFIFLEEDWNTYLKHDKGISAEIGAAAMVLSFFSDQKLAKEYYRDSHSKGSFKSFAQDMYELIPKAMASYASIGWNIHREISKPQ